MYSRVRIQDSSWFVFFFANATRWSRNLGLSNALFVPIYRRFDFRWQFNQLFNSNIQILIFKFIKFKLWDSICSGTATKDRTPKPGMKLQKLKFQLFRRTYASGDCGWEQLLRTVLVVNRIMLPSVAVHSSQQGADKLQNLFHRFQVCCAWDITS